MDAVCVHMQVMLVGAHGDSEIASARHDSCHEAMSATSEERHSGSQGRNKPRRMGAVRTWDPPLWTWSHLQEGTAKHEMRLGWRPRERDIPTS
jgi:hypothetical protein